MVVIRFQRRGTKKTPHHRIVVTDRRQAQSSRVLEVVGHYYPAAEPPKFDVNETRLASWVSSGAQVSEAVQRTLGRFRKVTRPSAKR